MENGVLIYSQHLNICTDPNIIGLMQVIVNCINQQAELLFKVMHI